MSMTNNLAVMWRVALALLIVVLGACAAPSRTLPPAQVEERAQPSTTQRGSDTQIAAYTPPAQPQTVRAQPKRAVSVLMRRAEDQRRAGDLDGATASLERALRIEPGDAVLWHRLADVRLAQRRHTLVEQLAAKSNALAARDDGELRARNWQLIAAARRGLGDMQGARQAERTASAYR